MATVDAAAILTLTAVAVVASLLVRSRRHHQNRMAEHAARFAPLVDLFGGALGLVVGLGDRLDTVFELATLNESVQRI